MEQNSTQELGAEETPLSSETPTPVQKAPEADPSKKTTIQVFTSTTRILTAEKHGNDTYDDVIRRDRNVVAGLKERHPEIYRELAGKQVQ